MPAEHHNATGAWMAPMETRKARAEYYFQTVLAGQREWYSKNASQRCSDAYGRRSGRYLSVVSPGLAPAGR